MSATARNYDNDPLGTKEITYEKRKNKDELPPEYAEAFNRPTHETAKIQINSNNLTIQENNDNLNEIFDKKNKLKKNDIENIRQNINGIVSAAKSSDDFYRNLLKKTKHKDLFEGGRKNKRKSRRRSRRRNKRKTKKKRRKTKKKRRRRR